MKYFITKENELVKETNVLKNLENEIEYFVNNPFKTIVVKEKIKYEMHDDKIYTFIKKGLFGKVKEIEVKWIPKYNLSGNGYFKDKKGNEYILSYEDVKLKE